MQKACSRTSKEGSMALLSSSLPGLCPPQERLVSTYWGGALGCSEGLRPLFWLSDHRKGDLGKAEARKGRKDTLGKQERPSPERDGKLDGKEAGWHIRMLSAKLNYVVGFWGAFNYNPCVPWLLLPWERKGWWYVSMPLEKKKKKKKKNTTKRMTFEFFSFPFTF